MNWKRIPKEKSNQPTSGTYKDWKPIIAEEGFHQCVYCSILESSFGGIRNFHVEHYKPKGKACFAHLENTYSNLFFACSICNCFKSNDWPGEPNSELNNISYPNPSVINYADIFDIDYATGLIKGRNVAAKYVSNKLYLNRPQLIINRREIIVERKYRDLITKIHKQFDLLIKLTLTDQDKKSIYYLQEINNILKDIEGIFHSKELSIPYTDKQIKKTND